MSLTRKYFPEKIRKKNFETSSLNCRMRNPIWVLIKSTFELVCFKVTFFVSFLLLWQINKLNNQQHQQEGVGVNIFFSLIDVCFDMYSEGSDWKLSTWSYTKKLNKHCSVSHLFFTYKKNVARIPCLLVWNVLLNVNETEIDLKTVRALFAPSIELEAC